jgi:signal transduction histidine kinase
LSWAQRFLLGSLAILVAGMTGIGVWVSRQIEDGVVHRTASTTALYVDSLIAAPLQDLAAGGSLSAEAIGRLDWLLRDTPLGQQVAMFRIWDPAGRIVYSTLPGTVGQQFPVEGDLAEALAGEVTAAVGEVEGEIETEAPRHNLLEIYSPVRGSGTDEVIAVAEFYFGTEDLQEEIAAARRRSWLIVGGGTLAIYLLLAVFAQRASNTIARQQRTLAAQVDRLTELLDQNAELHERVRGAAARTTALNERFLRRFSAELHDGPAQDIGLALLRLDHVAAQVAAGPDGGAPIGQDLEAIQASLRRAMQDVRATSAGLLLPQLEGLTLAETIDHAARSHTRRTRSEVRTALEALPDQAPLTTKIALYRIVQEALTNSWRHAGGQGQSVRATGRDHTVRVEISDRGPGFDPATIGAAEDHLGLVGMRERAESLGGEFRIESAPGQGARIVATLPLQETGEANG